MIVLTAKIYISETETIEVNRYNLLSIEYSTFDRSDLNLPSWGIITNTGNIKFNDNDGKILEYAKNLQLIDKLKCEIFLTNTFVSGATQIIATSYTDKWDYDNDNKIVSVSLKDDLEEWQDILIEKYPLQNSMSMYEICDLLIEKTPTKFEFVIDEETVNELTNIICHYPYLERGNLWGQWNKLCEACALYIYKNNEGKVIVKQKI